MTHSFDDVANLLDDLAEQFPPELFAHLNGGINLLPDEVLNLEFQMDEMYVLGAYCRDGLGRYINLYYGSFAALAEREDWSAQTWKEELQETLAHELTHHMEGLAGLHALDDRDEAELWQARQELHKEEQ